jgi:hypothetical protein
MKCFRLNIYQGELGQSMTEYLILITLVALVSLPVWKMLPEAVRGYVRPFYYSVSLPIP